MPEALQDAFDEIIPGAADKATLFLQVVRDRAMQEDLGLEFTPRLIKRTQQIVLEANIQLGGAFFKGAPMRIIVHADPVGSSLQVGWQLTEERLNDFALAFDGGQIAQARMQNRNLQPENQRRLSGLLTAFHRVVFMPVLQMLVEAMESASRPQGGSGFLGA